MLKKQKHSRLKQKELGKKQVRGYVHLWRWIVIKRFALIRGWLYSEGYLNAVTQITYAAYICGQIKLLNELA